MRVKNIFKGNNIQIDYMRSNRENKKIAFTFTSLYHKNLKDSGFGAKFLQENNFDIIAFKSSKPHWFQVTPESILAEIDEQLEKERYSERVGYGASMGGFAAIAFSKILNMTKVIAFSPQYRIDCDFDTRWSEYAKHIKWRYSISNGTTSSTSRYYLIYDDNNKDKHHVNFIKEFLKDSNITEITTSFSGHSSVGYLNEIGKLKPLVGNIFSEKSFEHINITKNRRKSVNYLQTRSKCLEEAGKICRSSIYARESVKLNPNSASASLQLGRLLLRLGQFEEGIDVVIEASKLNPRHVDLRVLLSQYLVADGNLKEAIKVLEAAVEMAPKHEEARRSLSSLVELCEGKYE
ncbi:tetratricopeptide repeat protein [Stappia sp. GBMRC 2046]|uniref:Tetratricopeptide repeat protein n=1 Tax=Stappia sediminis TaxID=2692190 RepID=A0A7X3LVS9_9HYPH|nr:tetratricopeptide repeat protein [Stappia sediminis]MXN66024.1 tetratricopeptide repeat protein [Stappia sediminis]